MILIWFTKRDEVPLVSTKKGSPSAKCRDILRRLGRSSFEGKPVEPPTIADFYSPKTQWGFNRSEKITVSGSAALHHSNPAGNVKPDDHRKGDY